MTTAYTSLLGLALPVQGELSGTWGDMVDNAITSVVDVAVAGTQSITGDTNVTLTVTNGNSSATNLAQVGSGTTGSAQYAIINCTGARTAARTITVPASSREYTVINATTGGFAVNVVGAGPTTGVSVANGEKCVIAWNGSDFVKVATSTAGAGTVTAVSVASANGFTGTSSGGATPALTLATSVTGIIKGNGAAMSAATAGTDYLAPPSGTALLKANSGGALANATAGTDYVAPGTATTFTATQTFNGTSSTFGASLLDSNETVNVVAAAPSATTNFYIQSGAVQYYTSNAANNWTLNIAFSSGTSLNTALATGQSVTFTLITTQGSTAYYNNAITIDGASVTPKWIGGAPTAGNASGLDVYRFAVVKTAVATYTVLASLTQYK